MTTNPIVVLTGTCADCRYVGTYRRPKIMDSTGFDDQLMFEDTDETVYMCKAGALSEHANTERIVPITCDAWKATGANYERLAELDRLIAARDARNAARTSTDAKPDPLSIVDDLPEPVSGAFAVGKIEAKK